jgi:DNA repair protein RadC
MLLASPPRKPLNKAELLKLLDGIAKQRQEHLMVLSINGHGRLIAKHVVYIGTIDRVMIHPREVFAHATRRQRSGIYNCAQSSFW